MKKVIFVCLLTLSVCLSDTDVNNGTPSKSDNKTDAAKTPAVISSIPTDANAKTETKSQEPVKTAEAKSQEPVKPTETKSQESVKTAETKAQESEKSTETKSQDTTTTTQNTKITPASEKNANNTSTNSTDGKPNEASTSTTVKPAEHTTPNSTATASASTPEKATTTTMMPAATTVQPHALQARGFDGASFVGGIILTLGLLAVGFMGFKYYKAQTERNYHTL